MFLKRAWAQTTLTILAGTFFLFLSGRRVVRSQCRRGVRLFVKCSPTWRATTSDPPLSYLAPLHFRAKTCTLLPPFVPDGRMIYSAALAVDWLCDPLPLCVWRGFGERQREQTAGRAAASAVLHWLTLAALLAVRKRRPSGLVPLQSGRKIQIWVWLGRVSILSFRRMTCEVSCAFNPSSPTELLAKIRVHYP